MPLPMSAKEGDKPPLVNIPINDAFESRHSGGTAMFRRSVLNKVGAFNPYLYSDEEPDLSLRIRRAGHRIIKLGHPIAYDYTDPADTLSTKIARWKRNLYLGAGQNLRYHLGDDIFWPYLRERGFGLTPILGLIIGLVALFWFLATGQFTWFGLWMMLLLLIIIVTAYRKQSLYQAIVTLVERLLIADGTIRGFLIKPLDPDKYPGKYDLVK